MLFKSSKYFTILIKNKDFKDDFNTNLKYT